MTAVSKEVLKQGRDVKNAWEEIRNEVLPALRNLESKHKADCPAYQRIMHRTRIMSESGTDLPMPAQEKNTKFFKIPTYILYIAIAIGVMIGSGAWIVVTLQPKTSQIQKVIKSNNLP